MNDINTVSEEEVEEAIEEEEIVEEAETPTEEAIEEEVEEVVVEVVVQTFPREMTKDGGIKFVTNPEVREALLAEGWK